MNEESVETVPRSLQRAVGKTAVRCHEADWVLMGAISATLVDGPYAGQLEIKPESGSKQ